MTGSIPNSAATKASPALSDALKQNKIGLILDFVPNHMGVGQSDNAWWLDVLEWGQRSPYAAAFDIDWEALPFRRHPGVLLPILGRPYGDALQSGEIALKYDADTGSFAAWYFEHRLPINPQRYSEIIRAIVTAAQAESEPAGQELAALAHDYRDPATPSYRDAAAFKQRLVGHRWCRRRHRTRACRLQRRQRDQPRQPASAARASELPPRLLARRLLRR